MSYRWIPNKDFSGDPFEAVAWLANPNFQDDLTRDEEGALAMVGKDADGTYWIKILGEDPEEKSGFRSPAKARKYVEVQLALDGVVL
jgi:hypothetical protein